MCYGGSVVGKKAIVLTVWSPGDGVRGLATPTLLTPSFSSAENKEDAREDLSGSFRL